MLEYREKVFFTPIFVAKYLADRVCVGKWMGYAVAEYLIAPILQPGKCNDYELETVSKE